MNSQEYRKRLESLESILHDSEFLLKSREFPIYSFQTESYPDEIPLVFQPARLSTEAFEQTILDPDGGIVAIDNYLNRNFACKLCPDRDRGIRSFLTRGRKKLLILHYSGDTGGKNAILKKNNRTIFRTKEIQESFQELIDRSLDTSYEEFFFQEYPACHFSKNMDPENWVRRTSACDEHVWETIQKENIKALLVLGSSAVLRWTPDFCKQNQGKLKVWTFPDGTSIPFAITRSPDALQHAKIHNPERYPVILEEMSQVLRKLHSAVGGFD